MATSARRQSGRGGGGRGGGSYALVDEADQRPGVRPESNRVRIAIACINLLILGFAILLGAAAYTMPFGPPSLGKGIHTLVTIQLAATPFVLLITHIASIHYTVFLGVISAVLAVLMTALSTITLGFVGSGHVRCDTEPLCARNLLCTGAFDSTGSAGDSRATHTYNTAVASAAFLLVLYLANVFAVLWMIFRKGSKLAWHWTSSLMGSLYIAAYAATVASAIGLPTSDAEIYGLGMTLIIVGGVAILIFGLYTHLRTVPIVRYISTGIWLVVATAFLVIAIWFTVVSGQCSDYAACSLKYDCTGTVVSSTQDIRPRFVALLCSAWALTLTSILTVVLMFVSISSGAGR